MTAPLPRRLLLLCLVALAPIWSTGPASACPFCNAQGKTLTEQVNEAALVVCGTLSNAKLDANADFGQGTTDLRVETVLKKHAILGDKKVLPLPRYLPTDKKNNRFLVFCDVYKGKVDLLGGMVVKKDGDMIKYLRGALTVEGKEVGARLRYFFDYLDNDNLEISNDAYNEFARADYKDYRDMAAKLRADKIAKWIQDPNTPTYRLGLYASMLGHCGAAKDARMLRKMLDDPERRLTSGMDGMLAGYTLLEPKEGWAYTRGILKDATKDMPLRYAALRAARFFWTSRPDVVAKKDVAAGVALLLDDGNLADLAIDDLRKWGRWEVADRVLGLYGKASHDVRPVRVAIVHYAVSCPGKKAAAFVAAVRKKDPELVKDVEESLQFDTEAPPARAVSKRGQTP
ncbi:MAG TPA: hypothetical protein VG013_03575 [Gemmataceae bacterium]|jgi:hypothetical protein|nr:hypothetical protein [Gemmataceae bacterium]